MTDATLRCHRARTLNQGNHLGDSATRLLFTSCFLECSNSLSLIENGTLVYFGEVILSRRRLGSFNPSVGLDWSELQLDSNLEH